jgi:hypothetical protein
VAPKGADGRRPASGGRACGSGETKRGWGKAFSPHVEASVGDTAAGEAATAKIDASGRNSKTTAVGSVGGARDPAELNRCMSKPPMRRRSEGGG